ncbi:MAG: hypothetical protein WBD64_09350 [Candidatus Zixiibacteriota bacterium]
MARAKNLVVLSLILAVASTTCTKKGTTPQHEYREPLSFDIFKMFVDVPLDSEYVRRVRDTWDHELKEDRTIATHTWCLGDYRVFVYSHCYWFEVGAGYTEVLFFTTSQPSEATDKIHSTITVYEADVGTSGTEFSKIGTYVYLDRFDPIENETEAKNTMMFYIDQYLEKYSGLPYDSSLIDELKRGLQGGEYIRDWIDHYVCYEPPGDFGGAIIVNKLTSQLDFLGSSVFMGYGRRYFPPD